MAIETQDVQIDGQPISVNGTVTANQGTPNTAANKWPIEIVDSGGVNVATVNASNELLVTDTDLTLTQGSTTSGQLGPLIQGAVTTAAPLYTTAQTSPLSLTTAGALRTDSSATTQPVSGTVTANAGTGNFTVVQPTGTNLHVVVDSGTITTADTKSNTSTISQSTVTGTSSTILAANANRKRMVIFSAGANTLIAFSNSAASSTNFTYSATSKNVTIEDDVWTGAVQAITTAGSSLVTVTEMV